MSAGPLLSVSGLDSAVEGFRVTYDVDLEVASGGAVGLVGMDGAGKTSTFRSIMGLTEVLEGSIQFKRTELTDLPADEVPHQGIGYQPEDRKLFTGMTVDENLRLPIWVANRSCNLADSEDEIIDGIYHLFNELAERRNAKVESLSGGQAKMASIGRALALQPDLLILDEPLEGLAPVVVENLKEYIAEINDRGVAVLIAESNFSHLNDIVDHLYVIERGEILARGPPDELASDPEIQNLMQGSNPADT
jgi:branched-chain amino acid transport system ATP-binding protein